MSSKRAPSFLPVAAIIGVMITILFGGCPVAQQPTVPPDDQEQAQTPTTPESGDDLDRSIPPPNLDEDSGQSGAAGGGTVGVSGGGGTGGGGGTTPSATASIIILEPAKDLACRLGTVVDLVYAISDYYGALTAVDLVLVRDGDPNPVFSEPLASFKTGTSTLGFDTNKVQGLLVNDFAVFRIGIRYQTSDGAVETRYAQGAVTVDSRVPTGTWIAPAGDLLLSRTAQVDVKLSASDNRSLVVKVVLDPDQTPGNGNEWTLIGDTALGAGDNVMLERTVDLGLGGFPAGSYHYYVTISDGVAPATGFYAQPQLALTNRLVGDFELDRLTNSDQGAILQGFNFNDLAGSSMVSVPDLNDDGNSELIIGARFGKPNLNFFEGRGWGEAYLIYGDGDTRLKGQQTVNSVGASIPGLTLRGIRVPLCQSNYTEGLSDITVIDDMDGDDLPEIVFSFPRVESLNLGAPAWVQGNPFQHPELLVDEATADAGTLEYDAIDYMGGSWITSLAQFTRGGIVIVSSHNDLLTNPDQVTRKFDRVLDLHEIGQLFTWMHRPSPWPYILAVNLDPDDPFGCFDCIPQSPDGCECEDTDPNIPDCDEGCGDCFGSDSIPEETEYYKWIITWDVWLGGA